MKSGPGRPKGAKNKIPRDARAYIVFVVDQLEKEGKGLLQWAKGNPDTFWAVLFKAIVPKEIKAEVAGKLKIEVLTGIERAPNED